MKKRFVSFIIILFCIFSFNTNAQIYMRGVAPLNPGNLWKYVDIGWLGGQTNFFVTDSLKTFGNIIYNVVEEFEDRNPTRYQQYLGLTDDSFYVRYDIYVSDSVYRYYKNNCKIGDSWIEDIHVLTFYYSVIDTFTINAWGRTLFASVIKITDFSLVEVYQVWADSIGLLQENSIGQYNMILRGCVINGVVYGDTTTSIINDYEKQPNEFVLYQNYPNPFNTSTTISYALPFESEVSITIYDLTGSIIKSFMINNQSAGYKDLLWDGRNNYGAEVSSGVYIYTIRAVSLEGNGKSFAKSSKLMLLK